MLIIKMNSKQNYKQQSQICIRKINENIRNVKLGNPLTLPLKELNTDCRFKKFYNDFCDIEEGINHIGELSKVNCLTCGKEFKQKSIFQKNCSKECSNVYKKAYREANKDKIAERGKAYYEANKDKIAERGKAYREANKDKIAERRHNFYLKYKR